MLTFIDFGTANVVGISIDGEIGTQDFEVVTVLMKKKMQDYPKIRLYVEMQSFKGITFKGLIEDLKFGLESRGRFEKEAVVTEKKWIEKWGEIGGNVVPNVKVKAFLFEEKETAKVWVKE